MKKINWLKRLFLPWDIIVDYIESNTNKNSNSSNDELIKSKTIINSNKKIIEGLENNLADLRKQIKDYETSAQILKNKNSELHASNQNLKNEKNDKKAISLLKEQEIQNLKDTIRNQKSEMNNKWNDMFSKLKPLDKIEKTFFGKTGNKGKGELGEMQLETILEKSGLDPKHWTKNLMVGSKQVEFAIKAGVENKWIPVDSKVLETNINEDGKMIIDDNYKKNVLTQAKAITKYLSKTNTVDYGLLVLQNDKVYMSLYEKFPSFFKETIQEHNIYITSPSSFVQFSWSVSHIIDIYEKVHNDKKIYDDMIDTLSGVSKFMIKLASAHKDFNTAINKHYPSLQKKQNKLIKKLKKSDKVKEVPKILLE